MLISGRRENCGKDQKFEVENVEDRSVQEEGEEKSQRRQKIKHAFQKTKMKPKRQEAEESIETKLENQNN